MLSAVDLTPEQNEAIEYLQCRTESLLALQVGFGKTIITLTAFAELRRIYGPWKALVVSTKNICKHTWKDELAGWTHLPLLSYGNAASGNLSAVRCNPDILTVNFESLEWYLDLVDEGETTLPEVLVIDESSKMKAHSTKRFARLAGRMYASTTKGIKHYKNYPGYTHRFKRRWLLSATPAPEGYVDLWAQEFLLGKRRRLGENIGAFRDLYCERDRSGFGWQVIPAHEKTIEERLKYVMYLPKKTEYLDLPKVTHSRVLIPWEPEARERYVEMEKELEIALDSLDPAIEMDEIEIVAPNAGVLFSKLRQICAGFVYASDGQTIKTERSNAKCRALEEIRERCGDVPLLVFVQFIAETNLLKKIYPGAQIGLPDSLDKWSARELAMLVLHPRSAGHGINLQHGTNVCVYTSLPLSYEEWFQSWGRLHRRGQTRGVSSIRLERPNSVDQDAWRMVQGKHHKLGSFLSAMRERRYREAR